MLSYHLIFNAFLRHGALWLPSDRTQPAPGPAAASFVLHLMQHGYGVAADVLPYVYALPEESLRKMSDALSEIFRDKYNWVALRREWENRCDETWLNHLVAAFVNCNAAGKSLPYTQLPCGHYIPEGVFDMSQYNGCPLCGKPFLLGQAVVSEPSQPRKMLGRITEADVTKLVAAIVSSPVLPDATTLEDLSAFLEVCPKAMPSVKADIPSSDMRVFLADYVRKTHDSFWGLDYLQTPDQVLRFLWQPKCGQLRIVAPKGLIKRRIRYTDPRQRLAELSDIKHEFALHYTRTQGRRIAQWFEDSPLTPEQICIGMHPRRGMWVRVFRAVRMSEHARRSERLSEIFDRFYNSRYPVWQGEYEAAYISGDTAAALPLLKAHPGFFARHLFSAACRFDFDAVAAAFMQVAADMPLRLLVTLAGNVMPYFCPITSCRAVTLANGHTVSVELPSAITPDSEANAVQAVKVRKMVLDAIEAVYARRADKPAGKVYIDPQLFELPVPAGDRTLSTGVTGSLVSGEVFHLASDRVRVFVHWGVGMPAQHYDMDLSATLLGKDLRTNLFYADLNPCEGAIHSGDYQYIPDNVGVAEYISLDLDALAKQGYTTAIFELSAYSVPDVSDTAIIGWLDSQKPFELDPTTGVAYDPADVQCMLKTSSRTVARGIVFAVLDICRRSIMTLEVFNEDQTIQDLDIECILSKIEKIKSKMSVGELLSIMVKAGGGTMAPQDEADTIYSRKNWNEAPLF